MNDKTESNIINEEPNTVLPKEKKKLFLLGNQRKFEDRARSEMVDIIIALSPLVAWGVYLFGFRALMLVLISVIFSFAFDVATSVVLKKKDEIFDMSSVVIGIVTSLLLPPTAPLWMPSLAAFISIVLVKNLASRLTDIRLHPTAVAIGSLYLFFPSAMFALNKLGKWLPVFEMTVGNYEKLEASALEVLLSGTLPKESAGALFMGLHPGAIGEVSAFLLLAAGAYLCIRKIIKPTIPLLMSITVIILAYLYPRLAIVSDTIAVRYAFSHVFSGNLLFCGIFMQLYPASVPITRRAQLVCGVLGGVIVFLTRYYVAPNVGAICAMMIISLVARPLDYLLKPSVFGGKVKNEKKSSREIEK